MALRENTKRILTVLAGFLLVLVVLFLVMTQTESGRSALARQIENQFNNRFSGELTIEKLDGNLMKDLFASGISLSDSSGLEIVQIDSAIIRASWMDMINRSFSLAELEIINPKITLHRAEDGNWNISDIIKPGATSSTNKSFDLDSSVLIIRNASIETIDPFSSSGSWSNEKIVGLTARAELNRSGAVSQINLNDLAVKDFRGVEISSGELSLSISSEQLTLNNLLLENQLSRIKIENGPVTYSMRDSLSAVDRLIFDNVALSAQIGARDFRRLVPEDRLRGPIEFDARCSSESARVSCVQGRFRSSESSIPLIANLDLRSLSQDSLQFSLVSRGPIISEEFLPENIDALYDRGRLSELLVRSQVRLGGNFKKGRSWNLDRTNLEIESSDEFETLQISARTFKDSSSTSILKADIRLGNFDASHLPKLRTARLNGKVSMTGRIEDASLRDLQTTLNLSESRINGSLIDSAFVNLGEIGNKQSTAGTIWAQGGTLRLDALRSTSSPGELRLNLLTNNFEPGLIDDILRADSENTRSYGRLTSSLSFSGITDQDNMILGDGELVLEPSAMNLGEREINLRQSRHEFKLSRFEDQSIFNIDGDLLNGNVTTQFAAGSLQQHLSYWQAGLDGLKRRMEAKQKYSRRSPTLATRSSSFGIPSDSLSTRIEGNLAVNDLGAILNSEVQDSSSTSLAFSLDLKGRQLNLVAKANTTGLTVAGIGMGEAALDVDYSSLGNRMMEEPQSLKLEMKSKKLKLAQLPEMDLDVRLAKADDGFKVFGERLDVEKQSAEASIRVDSDKVVIDVDSFEFDSKFYDWRLNDEAKLIWYADGWQFENVEFSEYASLGSSEEGRKQLLTLNGGLFEQELESLMVKATDLNLDYLSDILEPKHTFGGTINADLRLARIQGNVGAEGKVNVDSLKLSGKDVGDLSASLGFDNSGSNRILADGVLMQTRPENPLIKDNDLRFKGFLPTKISEDNPIDLEVEINKLDLFFFDLMFYNELKNSGGFASGSGKIGGSYTRPIFNANLVCTGGQVTTKEYLVDYQLAGPFDVDEEGFELKDVELQDNKGGSAIVSGRVNFNDYKFFSYGLDIDAKEIQFINVAESDILPFYGFISGSGQLELTGPQSSTTLRGDNLTTTPDSEIFIPITEDELITDTTFILYADSAGAFPDLDRKRNYFIQDRPDTERSFVDGMDMYLNIDAPSGSQIHLVFDALLGDVVDATGSGQIQITSEGGEFLTHGTFSIDSGEYLFTASEFFSRKFNLLSGGTITWDGDPLNASLNIPASYQTRASLAGLAGYTAQQRVPLVIEMNLAGRVQSPLVDLSLSLDRSDRTWQGSIDGIESLINRPDLTTEYATSVLLTNTFLLTTNQQSDALGNVADEILFNSVSHLVMSQLNRFLSEALNLDFNVGVEQRNDLEQYDLTYGFALRLADERLVIRGEGVYERLYQGGGSRSSINDGLQGAFILEYKLNPSVAVEFFYRREGDLLEYTSPIGTSYGAGLVYQNEFANWGEFRRRVRGTIDDAPISSQSGSNSSN